MYEIDDDNISHNKNDSIKGASYSHMGIQCNIIKYVNHLEIWFRLLDTILCMASAQCSIDKRKHSCSVLELSHADLALRDKLSR